MKEEKSYGLLDCITERLMTEDTTYVTEFIDHIMPRKLREQLRERFLEEMKARGAMAR